MHRQRPLQPFTPHYTAPHRTAPHRTAPHHTTQEFREYLRAFRSPQKAAGADDDDPVRVQDGATGFLQGITGALAVPPYPAAARPAGAVASPKATLWGLLSTADTPAVDARLVADVDAERDDVEICVINTSVIAREEPAAAPEPVVAPVVASQGPRRVSVKTARVAVAALPEAAQVAPPVAFAAEPAPAPVAPAPSPAVEAVEAAAEAGSDVFVPRRRLVRTPPKPLTSSPEPSPNAAPEPSDTAVAPDAPAEASVALAEEAAAVAAAPTDATEAEPSVAAAAVEATADVAVAPEAEAEEAEAEAEPSAWSATELDHVSRVIGRVSLGMTAPCPATQVRPPQPKP